MRVLPAVLTHLQNHYDAHAAAVTATGVSLWSGIEDRVVNIFWAVVSGVSVFIAIQVVKRILKIK